MNRSIHQFALLFALALLTLPAALTAQESSSDLASSPMFFTMTSDPALAEGAAGGGGGGQAEPTAYKVRYLTRLAVRSGVSTFGTGGELATNLPYHLDLRLIGNYTDFNYKFYKSGFYITTNIGMANTGAFVDFYPWKSFRLSPGFLMYNTNRVRADLLAQTGATFTFNDVTYASDPADPVHAIGRLKIGGTGFMATTGWGHIISRTEKHWSFPFEIGAAFIDTPSISFDLSGQVCNTPHNVCAPPQNYPGFEDNLNAQLTDWNHRVKPFSIYPILKGGIAYTFTYRK